MADDTTLSHRAEVFRSKLIEDFQILECTSEEGRRKAPVYTSADIISQFLYLINTWTLPLLISELFCFIYGRARHSGESSSKCTRADGEVQSVQTR